MDRCPVYFPPKHLILHQLDVLNHDQHLNQRSQVQHQVLPYSHAKHD